MIFFITKFGKILIEKTRLYLVLGLLMLILYGVYFFEHYNPALKAGDTMQFSNFFDALWWGIITSTTVGYGDKFPITVPGKVLAVFYILITIGLLGNLLTKINENIFSTNQKRMNGILKTKYKNHIIIYGNKIDEASEMIEQFFIEDKFVEIVYISELESIPNEILRLREKKCFVEFIKGKPNDNDVLELAGLKDAKTFVLLNSEEDALMVSYIMNIKIQKPDIFIVAEIVDTPNFHKSFEMAGANKIIDTGSLGKNLMMRSIKYDVDEIMNDILSSGDGYEIYKQELSTKWIGRTFAELKKFFIDTDVSILGISSSSLKSTIYDSKYIICEKDSIFYVAEDKINKI